MGAEQLRGVLLLSIFQCGWGGFTVWELWEGWHWGFITWEPQPRAGHAGEALTVLKGLLAVLHHKTAAIWLQAIFSLFILCWCVMCSSVENLVSPKRRFELESRQGKHHLSREHFSLKWFEGEGCTCNICTWCLFVAFFLFFFFLFNSVLPSFSSVAVKFFWKHKQKNCFVVQLFRQIL